MGERLTKSDVKKIQEEINYRKEVVRKKEIEAVKEARAQGDLSENFEYHAAKQDKNKNDSRIRYLERMLRDAEVISDDSNEGEVGIHDRVEVYLENTKETKSFRIVTSVCGNSLEGRISIDSPMGQALLGHKAGERIYVQVNDDFGYYVSIQSIDKTPDEESEELRPY